MLVVRHPVLLHPHLNAGVPRENSISFDNKEINRFEQNEQGIDSHRVWYLLLRFRLDCPLFAALPSDFRVEVGKIAAKDSNLQTPRSSGLYTFELRGPARRGSTQEVSSTFSKIPICSIFSASIKSQKKNGKTIIFYC